MRSAAILVVVLAAFTVVGCAPTVPDIRNTPVLVGVKQLSGEDLNLGTVSYGPSSKLPQGTIISQTPAPGSPARAGQRVDVILAGPDPMRGPDTRPGWTTPRARNADKTGVSPSF